MLAFKGLLRTQISSEFISKIELELKVYIQELFWFHEVFLTLERKKSSSNQFNYEIEVQYN